MPEQIITPWSAPYDAHKTDRIMQSLGDSDIMEVFATNGQLPAGYGIGIDERCVEYPWALSRLGQTGTVLDAGSALNHTFLLESGRFDTLHMHIITLAPECTCLWKKGIGYLYEDLRNLPIRDAHYDTVVSISTLEHVGMDNSAYTGGSHCEKLPDDMLLAAQEMQRVVKPGGQVLLTVPFGKRTDLGIAMQLDSAMLDSILEVMQPKSVDESIFQYTVEGWQQSDRAACSDATYVEWVIDFFTNSEQFDMDNLPVEPDMAAASRAVACLCLNY